MADNVDNLQSQLKRRISLFLEAKAHREALHPTLKEVFRRGSGGCIFGGTLRDLMLFGMKRDPHDLDIVVSQLTPDLESYLHPHITKRTRFGGLQACIGHWDLDIWALHETWAFRERLIEPAGLRDLPKTTFLNVQAVAVHVLPSGRVGQVFENGFFRSICHKTIDINFEANPFPRFCAMNALMTAYKLDFVLAPRLVEYILRHVGHSDLSDLCDYQSRRYGRVVFGCERLQGWIELLADGHQEDPAAAIRLPRSATIQRQLPWSLDLPMLTQEPADDDQNAWLSNLALDDLSPISIRPRCLFD